MNQVDDAIAEEFRLQITTLLAQIEKETERGQEGQQTVTLDQQSVGRLSRMDALQNQAMAKATQGRRDMEAMRLRAALVRIDEGEFGYCEECGDEIVPARLRLDPAATRCVSCVKG